MTYPTDGPLHRALRKLSSLWRPTLLPFPGPTRPLNLPPVVVPIDVELARIEAGAMLLHVIETCPDCGGTTEVLALTAAGFPRALGDVLHEPTCPLARG